MSQRILAALLAIVFTSSSVLAWNDCGHMVCADIAWRDLKPQARRRIAQLLSQHPRYEKDLLRDMPTDFPDPDLYCFLKSATWPDMVRDLSNPMHATHHHPTWHYIDFPLVPPADAQTIHPSSPDLVGPEIDNVLKALGKSRAELASPDVPDPDKAIALCWLAHLTGDIHQPLHAVSLFSSQYPQGDKGGNLVFVRAANGEVVNLHYLWDSLPGPQSTPRAIRLIADNILANPANQRRALAETLSHRDFKAWADESYAEAREIVYLNFTLRGVAPDPTSSPQNVSPTPQRELLTSRPSTRPTTSPIRGPQSLAAPALPVSYEPVARELASRRLALAGYRLADELNELFAKDK